jgi:NitT/TauT family transport system ATP-binding protein
MGTLVPDSAADPSQPVIDFDHVARSFGGEEIYRSLSFRLSSGEFACILGPSGCGKSTALRLIGGLLPATSGHIAVAGQSPEQAWDRIAYVFQSPRLAPWRTAIDNITLAAELRMGRGHRPERLAKARRLLDMVGLGDAAAKYPYMLSGGERQRVAIARALAVDPDIVLMDEPFSALDPNTRRKLRHELVEIWRETGKTIVFVTHDIEEALVLADRILVMSQKPATIVEDLALSEPRPRDLATSPALQARRMELLDLFRRIGGGDILTSADGEVIAGD